MDWSKLPGTVLEGGYEIQELLAADESGRTFKIRVLGDASAQVVMRAFEADAATADEQIAVWNSAKTLQHPNLRAALAAGAIRSDGRDLLYVILPRADEVLEDALRERALNSTEAGELLLSASQALDYLHGRGFAHGCVSPQQVFAAGESIQLSTESIRRIGSAPPLGLIRAKYKAPESDTANVSAEADVWCLGATLFEALTQKECEEGCRQKAAELPGVFGTIAARCLDPDPNTRCKLAEVPALYRGKEASVGETVPARSPMVVAANPAKVRRVAEPRATRKLWVYAGAAVLVVFIVIWLARSKQPSGGSASGAGSPATPQVQNPAPAANAAAPTGAAAPTKSLPTNSPAARPSIQPALKRQAKESAAVNGPIWRVVLYTYSRREDAEKMARSIDERHGALKASVFTPPGQNTAFLVVVGGEMTYEQAAKLRGEVVRMGLPRDTYIQNYRR